MKTKHIKILRAIFSRPTPRNISWLDIEKLLSALGADVVNRGGSVVTFRMQERIITFHRPHPQKEAKVLMVKRVRQFLELVGIKP